MTENIKTASPWGGFLLSQVESGLVQLPRTYP